jgi:hypothetical protein
MKQDNSVLIIGDLHCPWMHKDAVKFLSSVKAKYQPKTVIFMGDEADNQANSYHEHDPNLLSAGDELVAAIKQLQPLYKMFPTATILESNHGSLIYRKALTAGLPEAALRTYRAILQAPQGWNWKFDHTINTALGAVYFHHGKSSCIEKLSKNLGMSAVQGHHHNKFYISYWSSPMGLYWDANAGCLVDNKSRAMAYGKNNLQKPIVGCLIIMNGIPQLIPMVLNKEGRWIGKL